MVYFYEYLIDSRPPFYEETTLNSRGKFKCSYRKQALHPSLLKSTD